ncbi:MAG: adenylate/guanylate cyclase domain-containing protein [Desulfobacteraceae bacterium]|nr:adenylate/guanylate cyclase domain-containing protein [Desulfobacteraceae bacterium]
MNQKLPDIQKFKSKIFQKKNVLGYLLSFSLKLMEAKQAGLLFGTDDSFSNFLPPKKWDRGVMHRFDGKGVSGFFLKLFGKSIVKVKKFSPVQLYQTNEFGDRIETEGVISYILRNHHNFYQKGIKILIIDDQVCDKKNLDSSFSHLCVSSYDGVLFSFLSHIRVNINIVRQFKSKNFIAAYIPDYGAIVFNTVDQDLVSKTNECFLKEADLKKRLDILITAIESASLAYLGFAKGKPATQVIWRKERELRKTVDHLKEKETQLNIQKNYLRTVGGVTPEQLSMTPLSISDGVYAFIDMVGSSTIREDFKPRDFFLVLNLCHEISAKNAARFACRVDNIIGDSIFFQNVSIFDDPKQTRNPGLCERVMLMTCMLASVFNEIHLLTLGRHPIDRERRVATLVKNHGVNIQFRAGLEQGTALIGPLGSRKRKIITAIGKAADTASRLESSGIKNQIHITKAILRTLDNAMVSKDTRMIRDIALGEKNTEWLKTREYMPFFDFYKNLFNLGNEFVQKRGPVSYKEFSEDITYLIQCIPKTNTPTVCSGI